jgi:hypothetical protein
MPTNYIIHKNAMHTHRYIEKTDGMLMKSQLIEWLASCERGGRGLERKAVSTQSLHAATTLEKWPDASTLLP